MKPYIKNFTTALIISAIVLFILGIWFIFFKAGLPFQDPTIEMEIYWAANYKAGTLCTKAALALFICGIVGKILLRVLYKNN